MPIAVGDKIPATALIKMGAEGPETHDLAEMSKDAKIVVFGLPGAYTGTCTTSHVPSFIRTIGQFRDKGVSAVVCVSVNDAFVMQAWGGDTGAADAGIEMLADADSAFTKAIGMDFTAPPVGLIDRSKRYAMVIENGVVTHLDIDENPGTCDVSAGEAVLAHV